MDTEVIKEYRKAFPTTNLTIYQQEMLEFEVHDLDAWRETIRFWGGNGYRAESVFKMIEYYKGVVNGTNRKQPNNGKRTDADVIEASREFYDNYPA